jgi:hypothetical protein
VNCLEIAALFLVQNADQVDHRVHPRGQPLELGFVAQVGGNDIHGWQHDQLLDALSISRRHPHDKALCRHHSDD